MRLDLRELIVNPEARLSFRTELETDRLSFPSVKEYLTPPQAPLWKKRPSLTLS